MYEIWYIPRIQDELVVAQFKTEDDAFCFIHVLVK